MLFLFFSHDNTFFYCSDSTPLLCVVEMCTYIQRTLRTLRTSGCPETTLALLKLKGDCKDTLRYSLCYNQRPRSIQTCDRELMVTSWSPHSFVWEATGISVRGVKWFVFMEDDSYVWMEWACRASQSCRAEDFKVGGRLPSGRRSKQMQGRLNKMK